MIKPDSNDPIKVRRTLAFWVSLYAFLILPNLLVIYHALWATEVELLKSILTYIGVLAAGPIGAYLYAAQKNGNKEK
ncbi:MAG: hypothetical protein L6Q57_03060 [Alphaproteobacteria bacterium]|nr:hypothetical protein [Alphaproteobacteria bacterium]